jgi:hypothetical protein
MEETSCVFDNLSVERLATIVNRYARIGINIHASDNGTTVCFSSSSSMWPSTASCVLVCRYSELPKCFLLKADPACNDLNISSILILTFQLRPAAPHLPKHRTTNNSRHIQVATTWTIMFRLTDWTISHVATSRVKSKQTLEYQNIQQPCL